MPERPLLTRRNVLLGAAAGALLAGCSSAASAPTTAAGTPSARPVGGASPSPSPSASPTGAIDLKADPATIIARSDIPILCYHQIREYKSTDSASSKAYIIPPADFISQLDTLKAGGYETVSPDQLVAHLTTGATLPAKPVMLSYDDADVDGFDVAFPAMKERGFTGTYFIMTVVLGKKHYMSKDQLRQLDAAGMTVAAHTWDHHRVDRYAGDDWRIQIDEPTKEIADIVGHPIPYFAYPFGAWNDAAFPHLQEAGFTAAFQLDSKPMDPVRPLYSIERKIANPAWSTATFTKELTTF